MKLYPAGLISLIFLSAGFLFFTFSSENKTAERPVLSHALNKIIPREEKINILFLGDIMLDRHVEDLIREFGDGYSFRSTAEIFKGSNLIVANLEGPIVENHEQTPIHSMRFSFPTTTATLLKSYGITHINLANNHSGDYGRSNTEFTREVLGSAGIKSFGDPNGITENSSLIDNERKLIFIGLNETFNNLSVASSSELVQSLKKDYPNYLMIAFIHWGTEYELFHNTSQENLAHALIDSGADLVAGHHPHVVEDIELYKGKLIFYSLGNFIFDQYFSDSTKEELAILVEIIEKDNVPQIESVTLLPIYAGRSNPSLMTEERKNQFFENLAERSGSEIREAIKQGIIK